MGDNSSSIPSDDTKIPAPCRTSRMFIAASDCTASRTVGRLTPSASLRARSDGRRSPGASRPLRICSWIAAIASVVARRLGSGAKGSCPFADKTRATLNHAS